MRNRLGYNVVDGKRVWLVTVTVASQEQYDAGPFHFGAGYEDGTLGLVIDSLLAIRDSIPEEHRDGARCEISSESGYEGSHYASIEVSYVRPATEEEAAAAEADWSARERAKVEAARLEYERLKARFA